MTDPTDNTNLIECFNCKGNGTILIEDTTDDTLEFEYEECDVCQSRGTLHTYYDRYLIREYNRGE